MLAFFLYRQYKFSQVKKGVMVAIGIAVAIVIVVILGFSTKMDKETTTPLNSTIVTPISTPVQTPTTQPTKGKNFSVTLSETVASSAH